MNNDNTSQTPSPSNIPVPPVPSAEGAATPPPLAAHQEHLRLKRRTHQRPKRHKHRDLTPEEDSRRRHIQVVLLLIPLILGIVGIGLWAVGYANQDSYMRIHSLINTGIVMMALGGAGTLAWFIRSWIPKIKAAAYDWRYPPVDTSLHWEHRHDHTKRRKRKHHSHSHHASGSPAAPSVPPPPPPA